ncbi:MAG: WYL domain-containing protein [Deltaproteobacteria bacterium]
MTRKAAPPKADARDRLRRVLFLVPYAVRHPGVPVRDLARRCGVSEKQILEDLDFLLGVGCPPFAPDDFLDLYVEGDRVHVALHQSFSRPPRFTESEAAALAAAARALGGEGRERVVRALRDAVPKDRRAIFEELLACIFAGSPPAKDSLLGRIEQAIAERRALRIRYFTATRGEESVRVVHPYTLAQRLGHWYLWGHDEGRGKALPFRLDRIRECAVDEKRFEPPTDAELARGRLFSEASGPPVKLRLGPLAAAWALARPGQWRVLKRDRKGGAVVEVPGVSDEWATRFALSFGGDAEVLGPPSARRHFGDAVRRALARYP